MRLVTFLILCVLISTSMAGQNLQDILEEASEIIEYKLPNDSSLVVEPSYFDFKTFTKRDNGNFKCDLYYKNNNVVEIRFAINNNREYRVFLYPIDSYVFYNIYVQDKISEKGFFAPGFFIYDKRNLRNIFIGFTLESLASLSLNLDLEGKDIDWRFKSINARSINRIIEVDKDLHSISCITAKESELLTYSKYSINDGKLIEVVHVYSTTDCEEPTILSEMTLSQIYTHLEEGFCNPALIFKCHPRLYKVDYLWGNLSWAYN